MPSSLRRPARGFPCPALRTVLLAAWTAWASAAFAWSNHTLAARPVLAGMPELRDLAAVRVESLESFLAAEAASLEAVLDAEERWAREHVSTYPGRPDALRFAAAGASGPGELRRRFVAATRIAPDSRLALFRQRVPGEPPDGRADLPAREVTTLAGDAAVRAARYAALREGEAVSPIAVLATACDEPDYGLDIGLWEDNGTAQGRRYGFGRQPFGNPALAFGSQAPFHMGFYHEASVVYAAAGFLKRTYPEYRIHLWKALALHALRTGHDYWGWRFAGWALHYLQDLTQPYHARVLPGVGTARMLWINALYMAGWPRSRDRAVTLVSNRHLALENFARTAMNAGERTGRAAEPLEEALAGATTGGSDGMYDDDSPRAVVSRRAARAADGVDRTLAASLPARYVDDPGFEFGAAEDGIDLYAMLDREDPGKRDAMMRILTPLMAEFGAHTRAFVRALLAASGRPARSAS